MRLVGPLSRLFTIFGSFRSPWVAAACYKAARAPALRLRRRMTIRSPMPGDRIQPLLTGSITLRSIFTRRLLVIALLGCVPASADVVETRSGDRLTGTVIGIKDGKLQLVTDYAGTLAIDPALVVSVRSEAPLVADTTAGERITGRLDGVALESARARVAIVDSAAAAPDAQTLDAGKGWKSRADAAVNVTSGNTDTRTYNLRAESSLASKDSRHLINAAINNAENDGETTRDDVSAGYEYNWLFAPSWYLAANAGYFSDELKDVGYRVTVGTGVGYLFWETPDGRLSVDAGVSGVFEDLDGESEQNPALRWGLNFDQYLLPGRLQAFHKHIILALADSDRGQIFDSSTGLRLRLGDNLDATATVDLRYETEPAPGRDKTDTTYAVGVGYRF